MISTLRPGVVYPVKVNLSKVIAEACTQKKPRLGWIDAQGNAIEPPSLSDFYAAVGAVQGSDS